MTDARAAAVEHEALEPAPREMGWLAGIAMLVAVLAGTFVYTTIGGLLGIVPLWAGFAFALYWGAMMHADMQAMPVALSGALVGIAIGAALHLLPPAFGSIGTVAGGVLALGAVYLLLLRKAVAVVNNGTMLFLVLGTIPAVATEGRFAGMAGSVLLAAGFLAALSLVGRLIAARRSAA